MPSLILSFDMKPVILFDQDGTLLDSGPGIKHCAIKTLETMFLPMKRYEDMDYFIGPPLKDCFRLSGVPEERLDEAIEIYREYYQKGGMYDASIYTGITDLLQKLNELGYDTHVCTSKAQVLASEILHHFNLDIYFKKIYGASLDGTHALKKDIIARCLKENNIKEAVMIGDTYLDLEGANNNHIHSIGVIYGYGNKEEMEKRNPIAIVDNPLDIIKIIDKN